VEGDFSDNLEIKIFLLKWHKGVISMDQSDAELLKKFQEILEMSQEVKKADVAKYLQISEDDLFSKLVGWRHLGFKLKSELIIVENLEEFTAALDQQFVDWGEKEAAGIGKIENTNFEPIKRVKRQSVPKTIPIPISHPYKAHGISLLEEECDVLEELEHQLGKVIPEVTEIKWDTFGYIHENQRIMGLGIHKKGLTSLPESICSLKSLTKLDLGENEITSLPESIGQLKTLTRLSLYSNKLTSLPESINALTSLEYLNLEANMLSSLLEREENKWWLRQLNKKGCNIYKDGQLEDFETASAQKYVCPICDNDIIVGTSPCPNCQSEIDWS
jgi:Leucine rich repeat